jgi:hypothetical protein
LSDRPFHFLNFSSIRIIVAILPESRSVRVNLWGYGVLYREVLVSGS